MEREFHIGDVLSISTGKLVSLNHIDGVYEILNFMTQDELFTHQLPVACDAVRPALFEQHPWLHEVVAPEEFKTEADVFHWLSQQDEIFGTWHTIKAVPELWQNHDWLTDLRNMWGSNDS